MVFKESGEIKFITPFGEGIKDYPLPNKIGNHYGVDIVRDIGYNTTATIISLDDGIISEVVKNVKGVDHNSNVCGNYVKISHNDKYSTRYLHLKHGTIPDNIVVGAKVSKGDVIGYMGNTGDSYGSHLHFEVWEDGRRIDPKPYLLGEKNIEIEESEMYKVIIDATYETKETANAMINLLSSVGVKAIITEDTISDNKESKIEYVTHKVVAGDTLGAISRRYNSTIGAIIEINKNKYPKISASYIVVGWELAIPTKEG